MDRLVQTARPDGPSADARAGTDPAAAGSMPEPCSLAMPRQTLSARFRDPDAPPDQPDPLARGVRTFVLAALVLVTGWFTWEMTDILAKGGLSVLEMVLAVAFALSFVWIALAAVNAGMGALVSLFPGRRAARAGAGNPLRVALLLPTYNEAPGPVFGNAAAMLDALAELDSRHRFSLFVLSDTTDPATAIAEASGFEAVRDRLAPGTEIYYRRRTSNDERKAGNIADWCRRWGGGYDALLILDADSLMTGRAISALADALAKNPGTGLVQSVPRLVNGATLFARLQQFATAAYGPLLSAGLAVWSRGEANYWGHNAIIRTRAFAACAGLPHLSGRKPFGGAVMSHDFVEAALLRRAGWRVRIHHAVDGSYEECPPTLIDHVVRDGRWCQGNFQHLGVVGAAGLHPVSRFHLVHGVMTYLSSLLWLVFLAVGTALALQAGGMPVDYFPTARTLFPVWPVIDSERAMTLLVLTLGVLLAPKLFGIALILSRPRRLKAWGGAPVFLASALLEIVMSAALAPVIMIQQTLAIGRIVFGREAGWKPQRRDAVRHGLWTLMRFHWLETVFGAGLVWAVLIGAAPLWLVPVAACLLFAVPLSLLTGLRIDGTGAFARAFSTPELTEPPAILEAARRHTEAMLAVLVALGVQPGPTPPAPVDPGTVRTRTSELGSSA